MGIIIHLSPCLLKIGAICPHVSSTVLLRRLNKPFSFVLSPWPQSHVRFFYFLVDEVGNGHTVKLRCFSWRRLCVERSVLLLSGTSFSVGFFEVFFSFFPENYPVLNSLTPLWSWMHRVRLFRIIPLVGLTFFFFVAEKWNELLRQKKFRRGSPSERLNRFVHRFDGLWTRRSNFFAMYENSLVSIDRSWLFQIILAFFPVKDNGWRPPFSGQISL
jgi:hypothetical protein